MNFLVRKMLGFINSFSIKNKRREKEDVVIEYKRKLINYVRIRIFKDNLHDKNRQS
jgi:arabinogalactan endo-1,4-beta-galactosidase